MKAIIIEIKGNYAAVLSNDGVVSKIRNKNYFVGQEIVIKNNSSKLIRMTAAAAAAIMIFVTPAWAYLSPYSDVNPSFEFFINRFDRVLTVRAFNDDGRELSKNINIDGLKNKEIQSALMSVLNELESNGYIIEGQEDSVIVAASSRTEKKTNMLSEKLRIAVNEKATLRQKDTEIETKQNPKLQKPEKPKEPEKPEEPEEQDKPQDMELSAQQETEIEEIEEIKHDDRSKKPEKLEKTEEQKKPERWEKSEGREEREEQEKSEEQEDSKGRKPEKSEKSNNSERKNYNVQVIEVTEKEVLFKNK